MKRVNRRSLNALFAVVSFAVALFLLCFAMPSKAFAVDVSRYAGVDMFETAAAEARAAYQNGSPSAILVGPGGSWVDALSAAGLAASKGPILFTDREDLSSPTAKVLSDLRVKSVIVVGGTVAVSDTVVAQLSAKGIALEARLGGTDCYDTQMEVYNYGLERGFWDASMAIVATGDQFADALSVSPVAYAKKAPIFLVEQGSDLREPQKRALLKGAEQGRFSRVLAVGGTAVVSDFAYGFLELVAAISSPDGVCEREAGVDRYDTSAAIAGWAVDNGILSWDGVAFASGSLPYDALAGSVLQGATKSVMLLVGDASSSTIKSVVTKRGSISTIRYFGGTSAISNGLCSYIERSMEFGRVLPMGATSLSDGSYLWCNSSGVDRQDAINRAMRIARSCLGIPYVWLGKYPEDGGMDCASFTWHIYTRNLGMDIGFETYDQINAGYRVASINDAKPGDLILMYFGGWPNYNPLLPEHVVLYAGNGMIYEEPDFGMSCQYVPLSSKGFGRMEVRRIVSD
ncbi:cell wall-binding repeat-containing protein [Eggerthella guodeyinii]|uniref:Cell wall-binding repeat-containing protein n=1 Tax=Eggerthella guodeyinii TaxID=2690837 RepID=A0A6L7IZD6_9ACTN|nr:cell wall-binding repeat-containing protein [Eggerthella guodeyinii]QOS67153.1 cell wall-binding repeat-containing protein [Eggerthella guodeyinii]